MSDEPFARLRAECFPALERWAYFGWASVAPLSTRAAGAMRGQIEVVRDQGVTVYKDWYGAYDGARAAAAALLGAAPGEIALLKNTSEGISTAAFGLDLHAGENVILPRGEFPANAYAWLALRERGVEIRRVETDAEGRYTPADVERLLDARTRAVAVSFVNFATGFRTDLAGLGRLCREQDVFFFVDAIQGLGALSLDVAKMRIDGLAADGHKWLCGPEGQALFYIRREWQNRVCPLARGWWPVRDPGRYDLDDQPLCETARRYECGTLGTAGVYGLRAAVELALEAGISRMEKRIEDLTRTLSGRLQERGYPVLRAEGPEEWSGIVSFETPGHSSAAVAKDLERAGIVVNARGGRLRAAVHAWNNEADVARLVEALPRP